MTETLTDRLWAGFAAGAGSDFLLTPERRITYREAGMGIGRWLAVFDKAGLVEGDRVVIRTDRDDVAAVAFLAALLDGVVPVLLEGTCPDTRLSGIVASVEPGLVLSDAALPDLPATARAEPLVPDTRAQRLSLFGRSGVDAAFGLALPPAGRAPRLPMADGLAYLLFTSGTTSAPSGVEITRGNLAANLSTLTRLFYYGPRSRIYNDMILAHADGMIQGPVLAAWCRGAVIRSGGFDLTGIEDWLGRVRRLRATHVLAVPTVWSMIDSYASHDDYFDSPECEVLMTVAAKMPDALWERIERRFSRPLVNHYGLTETVASALYAGTGPELGATGSLGRPVDCEARIADGAEEGELQLRGTNVFPGYWRNPERTQGSFTPDGWFRTGDLVRRRADGSYDILGRLKSVIMSGGILIRPDEIDEAMQRHPAVLESATIGIEDEIFGEIGITGVVLKDAVPETDLTKHLRRFVEPRKVSKRILTLPEIPRGLSGKVRMNDLRAAVDARLKAEGDTASPVADVSAEVLNIAADVFRVPVGELSRSTVPGVLSAWDSFTHLNLILAVETRMKMRLPAGRVSAVRSLGDLIQAVEDFS